MSDYGNLQEENIRLKAKIERLEAELTKAKLPEPKPAQQAALAYPSIVGQHAAQAQYISPNLTPAVPTPE